MSCGGISFLEPFRRSRNATAKINCVSVCKNVLHKPMRMSVCQAIVIEGGGPQNIIELGFGDILLGRALFAILGSHCRMEV
jgi:hypothetical protein